MNRNQKGEQPDRRTNNAKLICPRKIFWGYNKGHNLVASMIGFGLFGFVYSHTDTMIGHMATVPALVVEEDPQESLRTLAMPEGTPE